VGQLGELHFDRIDDLEVLPQHRLVEIEHFFATYKLNSSKAKRAS
jgi:inorganic pyrophosphatase